MPELPDVEGFRRYFSRFATGKQLRAVEALSADMIRNSSAQGLGRALRGRRFERPQRHGKWLLAPAGGPVVLMHFGMTGGLRWYRAGAAPHTHDRVLFRFADGTLAYRNMRKFGGVWLARDAAAVERVTGPLGPDAARVAPEELEDLMEPRRGGLKAALMDQRLLAGIGNELSDEILWQARIAPGRNVGDLGRAEVRGLHRATRQVLRESMRRGRIPRHRDWLSSQRGVRNPRCPRCREGLRRETVAGRTAYWCSRCQS